MSITGFLVLSLVCGVVAAFVVQVVSRTPPVALAFGLIGGYLPMALVSGRARRRQRELAEVWPEAVDNLASAVRAGMSLPDALAAVIQELNRQGTTVLLIEHDMALVTRIAQRIAVLDFGCKITEGTPDEIKRHPDVIAAYLGTEETAHA